MPLVSTTPAIVEDKTYPYLAASLIINPAFRQTDVEAQTVIRFIPFRVDETTGEVEALPAAEVTHSIGDAFKRAQVDAILAQALQGIMGHLQNYINSKGL